MLGVFRGKKSGKALGARSPEHIGQAGCDGAACSWGIAAGLMEGNSRPEVVSEHSAGEHCVLILQTALAHGCGRLTRWASALQPPPSQQDRNRIFCKPGGNVLSCYRFFP